MEFPAIQTAFTRLNAMTFPSREEGDMQIFWFNGYREKSPSEQEPPAGVIANGLHWHRHEVFELHILLGEGQLTYQLESGPVTVCSGRLLLIPPGLSHRLLRGEGSPFRLAAGVFFRSDSPLGESLAAQPPVARPLEGPVGEAVAFFLEEARRSTAYSPLLIRNRLLELMCALAGPLPGYQQQEQAADPRLEAGKAYVRAHPELFLTCRELAAQCGLSVRQLGRLFRQQEKLSPLEYLHRCKLEQARLLLADGSRSLREISEALGFQNEYYFNAFFSRYMGLTPGGYRKNLPLGSGKRQ